MLESRKIERDTSMVYTELGQNEIEISRICIGGVSFGQVSPDFHQWVTDQLGTQAVIKEALNQGTSFIGTAIVYAHGTSEGHIGKPLKNLGVKRVDIMLASKGCFNEGCFPRETIQVEIGGTLRRLGTDYRNLCTIHRFDYTTSIEETMEALDALVKAGKIRALGASAMYAYQFYNMQVSADENGWARFSSMQCHYNLLYCEDEHDMIPVCRQYGVSITPYSPLTSDYLTRPTRDSTSSRSTTDNTMRSKY